MMRTREVFKNGFYWLLSVALALLAIFQVMGILLYIVFRYTDSSTLQPFEMATISGLIGGFALAGGFSDNERLRSLIFSLRRIGAIFISSTIAFFLFGLFLPLTEKALPQTLINIATPISVIAIYAGAILFTFGTIWFLRIIPKLFRDE